MIHIDVIKNFDEFTASLMPGKNRPLADNRSRMKLAAEWLLKAQSVNGDNGYAHSYSLLSGWERSYPETTGYIIPTMLNAADHLGDEMYRDSAMSSGEWLLVIQKEDGAFPDMRGDKQIFDTGQILEGLLVLYKRTGQNRFFAAAVKAGNFLTANQDGDGKWTRFSYNGTCHTYYSKVAANLLKLYAASNDKKYYESAGKNIEWVLKQQGENGYFDLMSFTPDKAPYLHTIIYVLEGLLDSYNITAEKEVFAAVKNSACALLAASEKACDPVAYSQYDKKWHNINRQRCLTGLAQWAGLLLNLYKMEKEKSYYDIAEKTIAYLKSRQIQDGRPNIKGALSGSAPIWGSYFKFAFNNWTVKYFIDALLSFEKVKFNDKAR